MDATSRLRFTLIIANLKYLRSSVWLRAAYWLGRKLGRDGGSTPLGGTSKTIKHSELWHEQD